ncbi:MAG: cupin domain-containing protein [Stellaceae bacterium]
MRTLAEPTLVRASEVPRLLWGDEESGYVNDCFYALSAELLVVGVTLPPGGRWRSSERHRALFDTHECLCVLAGQYTCHDPETGEVRTLEAGEALFMPERRWHYGNSFGNEDLHMLEIIAPPTNQSLAHVPRPRGLIGRDSDALRNWPREHARGAENFRICRLSDALDAVVGDANPILCRVLASTDRVFSAMATVPAGGRSDEMAYPFDVCYCGIEGETSLFVAGVGTYFAVREADVAFLPAGTSHRLFNHTCFGHRILVGGAGNFARLRVS